MAEYNLLVILIKKDILSKHKSIGNIKEKKLFLQSQRANLVLLFTQ